MRNAQEGFRGLKVYQKAYGLVKEVYETVKTLPESERYNISSQIKRAATSVSLNIAEGYAKKEYSKADYIRFLLISKGSAYETEVLLDLCRDFGYMPEEKHDEMIVKYEEVVRMISGLIKSLNPDT